jgi:hypothetical protein
LAPAIPNQDADPSTKAPWPQCVPVVPDVQDWNTPGSVRHDKRPFEIVAAVCDRRIISSKRLAWNQIKDIAGTNGDCFTA